VDVLVEPVPQKHLLTRLETENPHFCGFSRCFLMGRPGLEPGTLCLKDSGGDVQPIHVVRTPHSFEENGPLTSVSSNVSINC
jgi:hypothetical protein